MSDWVSALGRRLNSVSALGDYKSPTPKVKVMVKVKDSTRMRRKTAEKKLMVDVQFVQTSEIVPSAPSPERHVTTTPSCRHCRQFYGEPPPSYTDSQRDHAPSTQNPVTSQHY